jgi:hypothetical protein
MQDPEPIYANVNPGLSLDTRIQQDFMQSIHQQTAVALRRPDTSSRRPKPPTKPVRNSILLDRHHLVCVPASAAGTLQQTNPPPSDTAAIPPSSSSSVAFNPVQCTPTSAVGSRSAALDGKENLPSTAKKSSFLFTPLRRTAFKKIGDRKLIRIKKKSLSPGTPKPSFKRIGNKKLIRIRDSLTGGETRTPAAAAAAAATGSPMQLYDIKTKTKLVKNTPSNAAKYRFSFITPLSVRKLRLTRDTPAALMSEKLKRSAERRSGSIKKPGGNSFANRFKLDRRPNKAAAALAAEESRKRAAAETAAKERSIVKRPSQSRLKKLSGSTYHVRYQGCK